MALEDLPAELYEQFARVGQALATPHRLRLLNLLCQSEYPVDGLAEQLGQSLANTSAHLKVLREARLVVSRREGKRVFYRPASAAAIRLWMALRDMGFDELPEVRELMVRYASEPSALTTLMGSELLDKVRHGEVVLLDLRPAHEYGAGHLPGARSMPFAELEQRLGELPRDRTLIAYCRGPFCVTAIQGTQRLRSEGLDARRLLEGVAEWRAAGESLDG